MAKQTKAEKIRTKRWTEIRDRYEQREPYSSIAKDIGVSPATMLKWLIQEGYKYKTKGRYPRAMQKRAKQMLDREWEIEDVADLLKVEKKLVATWYARPLPEPRKKPKENPAPRRHQLSYRARQLIGDDRVPRHRRGKRWEPKQKQYVTRLIRDRFSVIEIYRIMGASKARQSKIWKEIVGRRKTPPNFPTEKGPIYERRRLSESAQQRQRRFRRDVRVLRRQEAKDKMKERKRLLHDRRRAAADAIELPETQRPPPQERAPGTAIPLPPVPGAPPPPREGTRAFIEPEITPPSRQSELPRPPWEVREEEKKRRRKGKKG